MKKITLYLIDVEHDWAVPVELTPELRNYYELLNCTLIDVTRRKICGKTFTIICDDEALLKEEIKLSAIDSNSHPALCGNILIANEDRTGNIKSLTEKDLLHLQRATIKIKTSAYQKEYPVIGFCDYE